LIRSNHLGAQNAKLTRLTSFGRSVTTASSPFLPSGGGIIAGFAGKFFASSVLQVLYLVTGSGITRICVFGMTLASYSIITLSCDILIVFVLQKALCVLLVCYRVSFPCLCTFFESWLT
jgi:hypothetical protein